VTQPPAEERGPADEPARDSGLPGGDAAPGRAARLPGEDPAPDSGPDSGAGAPGAAGPESAAGPGGAAGPGVSGAGLQAAGGGGDPRLAGFAKGGPGDTCPPGPALAAVVAELSGPQWRCAGADDDELAGLLGRWQAIEAWAAAGKLGVIRELLRRRARPGPRGLLPAHGDLPDQWHEGAAHEVSGALGISVPSADNLLGLAWDLRARLPGTGAALAAGAISALKARIISDELSVLGDEDAAAAEKLVLDQLGPTTTPGMAGKLAAQAAVTVDPGGAAERRQAAERERARVRFWRENGGACALAAYGLPTDAALAANAAIGDRAQHYQQAKVRPGARMDQLRVLAFLDLLNGITLQDRITRARAGDDGSANPRDGDPASGGGDASPRDDAHGTGSTSGRGDAGSTSDGDRPEDGPGPGGPGGMPPGAAVPAGPALAARANLTLPLATLLGLADRPGTAHGLGPLDPALVRDLAAAAANSPHTEWCMTITGTDGTAVAHGCARPARTGKTRTPAASRDGPPPGTPWALTSRRQPAPAGGPGSWTLPLMGIWQQPLKNNRSFKPWQQTAGTCLPDPCLPPAWRGMPSLRRAGSGRGRRCREPVLSPRGVTPAGRPGSRHQSALV
jgi:Domain of unknown function (DUF222)